MATPSTLRYFTQASGYSTNPSIQFQVFPAPASTVTTPAGVRNYVTDIEISTYAPVANIFSLWDGPSGYQSTNSIWTQVVSGYTNTWNLSNPLRGSVGNAIYGTFSQSGYSPAIGLNWNLQGFTATGIS